MQHKTQHKTQRNLTALVAIALLATSLGATAGGQIFRWKIGTGGAPNGGGVLSAAPAGQPFGPRLPGNANWSYLDLAVDGPSDASGNLPVTYRFVSKPDGSQVTQSGLVSASTVGGLLRSRVFSSAGGALAGAMTSAGYTLDLASQTITSPDSTQAVGLGNCRLAGNLLSSPYSLDQCVSAAATYAQGRGYTIRTPPIESSPGYYWNYLIHPNGRPDGTYSWALISRYGTTTETVPGGPASDTALADWGYLNLTAGELRGLFLNPDTGAPLPIPEAQAAMDAL